MNSVIQPTVWTRALLL